MTDTTILTCGHAPTRDAGIGTGYAEDPTTGERFCYPCADHRQRETMLVSDVVHGYVSTHGSSLTTWTGGILARGIGHTVSRNGWHGSDVHAWRFEAPDGSEWYGRNGGAGMSIRVRRAKGTTA